MVFPSHRFGSLRLFPVTSTALYVLYFPVQGTVLHMYLGYCSIRRFPEASNAGTARHFILDWQVWPVPVTGSAHYLVSQVQIQIPLVTSFLSFFPATCSTLHLCSCDMSCSLHLPPAKGVVVPSCRHCHQHSSIGSFCSLSLFPAASSKCQGVSTEP